MFEANVASNLQKFRPVWLVTLQCIYNWLPRNTSADHRAYAVQSLAKSGLSYVLMYAGDHNIIHLRHCTWWIELLTTFTSVCCLLMACWSRCGHNIYTYLVSKFKCAPMRKQVKGGIELCMRNLGTLTTMSPYRCGHRLYTSESDVYGRQILTSKVDPRTEVFITSYHT